jgi:ribosomal RNA assembly protein
MPAQYLLVPEARIAVLIGPKGKTKRKIESLTGTKLTIDSASGEVTIEGSDALQVMKAEAMCKAIARGFAPEKAFLLAKDYYELRIINLREIIGKSRRAIHTKKARVIGSAGRIRKRIEDECNCYVSVYGDTIALIGLEEDIDDAESLIMDILSGAEIETAFRRHEERRLSKKGFEL